MKKLLQLSMLTLGVAASGGAFAQGACSVAFESINNWGAGGENKVTITNTGAAKTSWELCWTYPGNDKIASLWDATYTQTDKNVCAKNLSWNANLPAGGKVSFGFNVSNPGAAPTSFTLNGVSCDGSAGSSSSAAPSSSSSSSSSVAATPARWLLDASNSAFHFVSVKKSNAGVETPENFTFSQLQGTVAADGKAVLTIPLSGISTNNATRDPRMQNLLFEVAYLPSLHFSTQLDLSAVEAMAAGSTEVQSVSGTLTLHGVSKSIVFDALVVKNNAGNVSFSPRKPVVINSIDFDLDAGIEALRIVAGLNTIGRKVPVYFKMFLTRDNPTNVPAIALAAAPATPVGLMGSVSTTGTASLNWGDVSNGETGFLVRRKGADGRWTTASNKAANSVSHSEALLDLGSYDFKVISYTDSIPSVATAPLKLVYEGATTSSSSVGSVNSSASSVSSASSLSSGSSSSAGIEGDATRGAALWTQRSCVACHGVNLEKNADGSPAATPVNPNRDTYVHRMDRQELSLRDFIEQWMPEGNAAACTGQCAADLEAYIRTFRRASDGRPDNSPEPYACQATGTAPGYRQLRLLTRNEYQRSVRDLVNYQEDVISRLPDDAISGVFSNNNDLFVGTARYSSYLSTAERIADNVATRWNTVLACTPGTSGCADKLINDLAPRIFRRPLTTTEKTNYLALAKGTAAGRTEADGMKIALATMLSSPQFLYRSEVGDLVSGTTYKLNGYEMATYLSYTYTGSTPSAALLSTAGSGGLNTVAGIRQQAALLMDSSNTKVLLNEMVNRWLGTYKLPTQNKSGITDFPGLANDMTLELGKNFASAMLDSNATFGSLYNPGYTYVNQRLANHYGLAFNNSGADADGFVRANTAERGGILVSGAFMSRYAGDVDSNLITRAVAVRRRMMCQDIPEPPSGVSLDREAIMARDREFFDHPQTTPIMTANRITSGTTCSNCHAEIINPLGGGMENVDHLGRMRTVDRKGNAIVTESIFYSPYPKLQFLDDVDRALYKPEIIFSGAKDLARTMAEHPAVSQQAQVCLATQFVSFTSGVPALYMMDKDVSRPEPYSSAAEKDAYRCNIQKLSGVLSASGPRAMLQEIPTLDSVIYRQEWVRQ